MDLIHNYSRVWSANYSMSRKELVIRHCSVIYNVFSNVDNESIAEALTEEFLRNNAWFLVKLMYNGTYWMVGLKI